METLIYILIGVIIGLLFLTYGNYVEKKTAKNELETCKSNYDLLFNESEMLSADLKKCVDNHDELRKDLDSLKNDVAECDKKYKNLRKGKKIEVYDKNNKVAEFDSIHKASDKLNISRKSIRVSAQEYAKTGKPKFVKNKYYFKFI